MQVLVHLERLNCLLAVIAFVFLAVTPVKTASAQALRATFFDCSKLATITEQVACYSGRVQGAQIKYRKAFEAWLGAFHPDSRPEAQPFPERGSWDKHLVSDCGDSGRLGPADIAFQACTIAIFDAESARYSSLALRNTTELPIHRAQVAADDEAKRACERALNYQLEFDRFTSEGLMISTTVSRGPERIIARRSVRINPDSQQESGVRLRTGGDTVEILAYDDTASRYRFTWYVIPKTREQAREWAQRFSRTLGYEELKRYAAMLRHPVYPTEIRRFVDPTLDDPGSGDPNAPALYNPSNTLELNGVDVESEIVVLEGIAYLRAVKQSSLRDLPDAVLFRFGDNGELLPICWQVL